MHAAGVSRRQLQNVTTFSKMSPFRNDHIWNRHEKCIQKSTNTPGIGSLICEIDVKNLKCEKANRLLLGKTKARILNINDRWIASHPGKIYACTGCIKKKGNPNSNLIFGKTMKK